MIDWVKGTWEPGGLAYHYVGSSYRLSVEVFPGLYWHGPFGRGDFFRANGTILLHCTPQEAQAEAGRLGLHMQYVDSFVVSTFSWVMG